MNITIPKYILYNLDASNSQVSRSDGHYTDSSNSGFSHFSASNTSQTQHSPGQSQPYMRVFPDFCRQNDWKCYLDVRQCDTCRNITYPPTEEYVYNPNCTTCILLETKPILWVTDVKCGNCPLTSEQERMVHEHDQALENEYKGVFNPAPGDIRYRERTFSLYVYAKADADGF